jgi:hypothetical protein
VVRQGVGKDRLLALSVKTDWRHPGHVRRAVSDSAHRGSRHGAPAQARPGYLGGAIASYTRMGEPYPVLVPLSTSLIAWAGIYLREERLRSLLPLRRGTL